MSERFNVDVDDVLGSNYLVTSISSSNYNPQIDGTVTLTVTVKDVYGDNVNGESVTVSCSAGTFTAVNGSSITAATSATGTTNSSGQFTLTYTAGNWGLITISANNTSIQLNVDGWRYIRGDSSTNYAFLRNKTHGRFLLRGWSYSYSKDTSWANFGTGDYAASMRPNATVMMMNSGATAYFYVDGSGNVKWRAISGTIAANTAHYGSCEWAIRDEDLNNY